MLPKPANTTSELIYKHYESQPQQNRPHLGCSEIGDPCERKLWYSFRWALKPSFEGRILRLFNTGVREEIRVLEELKAIASEVHSVDPTTGRQYVFGTGPHFSGSCDAVAKGLPEGRKSWAVVEIKTHGEKSFKKLEAEGVAKAKPTHFVQMQMYMGFSGGINRALYFAVNKNTDEIYCESIHFDSAVFEHHKLKADRIINASTPPQKLSEDPAWFECKFCDKQTICHKGVVPEKNCRTCAFSTPGADGWECGYYKRPLSVDDQRVGCRSHLFIPTLISFAEATDFGPDYVEYKSGDVFFRNVMDGGNGWLSGELAGKTKDFVLNKTINAAKEIFGGRITT